MFLYNNIQWKKDIDEIINNLPELTELFGKRIIITGATGLICSSIIDVLLRYNETHESNIDVFIAGRNIQKVNERFEMNKPNLHFLSYDATCELDGFPDWSDYIIHGASNASPDIILHEPVESLVANFYGIKKLLDYAKEHYTSRILYISSSEVYGQNGCDKPIGINDYGYIDILNPRNSYSIGKCAAEALCISYYTEYKTDTVIVRPGHIYGPSAQKSDNRVSSAWAYAAARGEDILMKSEGTQLRSYCYCLDCAAAILKVLLKGATACAYNISNSKSILSIKQMAEILAKSANVSIKMELPTDYERKGFNPMTNSSLDSSELEALGWNGIFDAKTGFSHTVSILRDML